MILINYIPWHPITEMASSSLKQNVYTVWVHEHDTSKVIQTSIHCPALPLINEWNHLTWDDTQSQHKMLNSISTQM